MATGSWVPAPLFVYLGAVGSSPAQIQLRTLVPFLPPFPLPGTIRLAAAARRHGYHCLVTGGRRGTGQIQPICTLRGRGEVGAKVPGGGAAASLSRAQRGPRGNLGVSAGVSRRQGSPTPSLSVWGQRCLLAPPKPCLLMAH